MNLQMKLLQRCSTVSLCRFDSSTIIIWLVGCHDTWQQHFSIIVSRLLSSVSTTCQQGLLMQIVAFFRFAVLSIQHTYGAGECPKIIELSKHHSLWYEETN